MSDVLTALPHVSGHDYSWLVQFFSLLVLPFAHEDLAVILGAYVVVNDIMPMGLVALCIYAGMVASDFALYGIGAAWCLAPCSSRLLPAVGHACRSLASPRRASSFPRFICHSCSVLPSSSVTRLIAAWVGGHGPSSFA